MFSFFSSTGADKGTRAVSGELKEKQSPFFRVHYTNPILVSGGTAVCVLVSWRFYRRFVSRIPNAEALGPEWLSGTRKLSGVVTSVGDADNFRLFHKPPLWMGSAPTAKADLKDQTLHIRIAGVDAPELAHFGNPAQPFAAEALDCLTKMVLGKTVTVQPYSKDRYGRIVAMAHFRPFPWIFKRNISEEMLKAGLATVYTQGGAIHAGLLSRFERLEAEAKRDKRGMWSQSVRSYESPAQYKKRVSVPKT
ncbi:SNase-domain-containing protein [Meredithblackwellia eburnea MCA 4105]